MTGFDSCSWSCFRSERRRGGEEKMAGLKKRLAGQLLER
jgi:hypothetical protein